MKKFFVLLALMLLVMPVVMVGAQEDVIVARLEEVNANLPQGYGLITAEDLNVALVESELVLLDVRQPEEYEAGHLEMSFNVPIRELSANLNLLPDLDAPIIVICKGGGRAMLASTSLLVLGYTNVRVLRGGYDAWVGEELPVTVEPYTVEALTVPEFNPAVFTAVDAYLTTLPEGYGLVSATNVAAELVENPPLLIDVRSADEWNQGYIEGAQHIWINEFMSRVDELPADKDAAIVIYCQSGVRGGIATVFMRLLGYTNVRNMSGGVNAWVAGEFPLVGVPEAVAEPLDLNAFLTAYVAGLPETFNAVRVPDFAAEFTAGTDALIVDVRTPDEFAEGFIPGSINLPLSELVQSLAFLPNFDQPIVIVCGSGHRSALAMTALNLLGYTNVRSMMGGFGAWSAAGNPVTTEVVEVAPGTAPEVDPAVFEAVSAFMASIPEGYFIVRAPDLSVELIENPPVLLDVRTDGEWETGRIEGAVHVPLANMFAVQDQWPTDLATPIVVYDNPTHRSSMAMTFLRMLGYENVRVLAGGIGGWTNAGLELVTE